MVKKLLAAAALSVVACGCPDPPVVPTPGVAKLTAPAPPAPKLEVHFSPGGGCAAHIVAEIGAAKTQVRVLAYSFTSAPIAEALRAAGTRGVDVAVVADRSQEHDPHSVVRFLASAGIPVAIDAAHPIAHNKVIIVDVATAITGSYNFSKQSESNGENLVTIRDKPTAGKYLANWVLHRAHSTPLPVAPPK